MYVSKYNVVVDIRDRKDVSVLHNLFHGRVCLIGRNLGNVLRSSLGSDIGALESLGSDCVSSLRDRHFVYESRQEEEEEIATLFHLFQDHLTSGNATRKYEILLSYDCNLRCVYCFQKKMRGGAIRNSPMSEAQLDAIFRTISMIEASNNEGHRRASETPLLSVVGGEPLLPNSQHRNALTRITQFAREHGYRYSITTNGFSLVDYIDLFEASGRKPNYVQVTIDGPRELHDRRRIAIGGGGSFDRIVDGIEAGLRANIPIGVRVNVDLMNLEGIREIATLIHSNCWDKNPNFSAYLAPVTDHSAVNGNYKWIKSDATVIRRLVDLFETEPKIEELFTMTNFRGYNQVRELSLGGRAAPVFWRCEAVLGELVFDPNGDLYTCFEAAGQEKAKVGRYFPDVEIDATRLREWTSLNSFESLSCSGCRFRFTCASGCPWHIVGQGVTECLPIEEELDLAWNHFAPVFMRRLDAAASSLSIAD